MTGTLGRNANATVPEVEILSTCLALIEIVDSCNLACPTCFADSPIGATGDRLKTHSLESLKTRIQGVIDRKGKIEILQLSGGEPTLHPQFFELVDWIHAHLQIDYCLVNTNAVRVAREETFLGELGTRGRRGHFQLYLQFDGPQEAGQLELRGSDFRDMKRLAMERCEREGIPSTLAMTVTPENLPHLWDTILTGLDFEVCRGVSFQPMLLPVPLILGRIGCLSAGCCGGKICSFGRWPSVGVESGFQVVALIILFILRRKQWQRGQHFHLFLIAYGLFRFFHEFMRATPKPFDGLSGYQLIALATAVAAGIAYRRRNLEAHHTPC